MNKRERLEKAIAGEQCDRIPVALWRHWPGDDQRAADLAQAVLDFQTTYDWDFVTIMPANNFLVADYGIQDHWGGEADGTRKTLKTAVNRSLDWTRKPLTFRPFSTLSHRRVFWPGLMS
jgi:uroporphyrinogen decarboxylase